MNTNGIMSTSKHLLNTSWVTAAVVLAAFAFTIPSAQGQIVWNVNFGGSITPSDNYVGAAPENTPNSTWNAVTSLPQTAKALADSTGSDAGVTLDLSGPGIGGHGLTSGDKIFAYYIGGAGATANMAIKGLSPSRTYDVVIYSDWYWNNGDSGYPVTQTVGTGLTGTIYVNHRVGGTAGVLPPLTQDTNPANVNGATNWYRITGLTPDASGHLGFRLGDGANAPFNGFQLIEHSGVVNDTTPPTLTSLLDDKNGAAVFANRPVTYTVIFSEPMNAATVDTTDFENATATPISVNSVSPTASPAVFLVAVTPTTVGTLRLQVKAGATLTDLAGNALITTSAIPDDTTITVVAPPNLKCPLGILNLSSTDWINPATGKVWALGDKYRLAFVTRATTQATSTDITTYNTFVQGVANSSTLNLSGATWNIIGSTATVDARDNVSANTLVSGVGVSVFLVDGTTKIANDYNGLMWGGPLNHPLNLDERGVLFETGTFTGSTAEGTKDGGMVLGSTSSLTIGTTLSTGPNWLKVYNTAPTSFLPVYALSDPLAVVSSVPLADITSFTIPGYGAATISGTDINMTVPYGTDLTSLAPTYTLSVGATCVPATGTSQNFTHPVHYVVTASDQTTKDFTVTVVTRSIADPAFTLAAPATWDGHQTITVQSTITNQALLQATGGTNVNYHWSATGVAVIKEITPGILTLIRSQGNGPLTVTLTMDNGGVAVSHSVTVHVQQPASPDAWVQCTPGTNEKPVTKQFFARDPNTNNGTLFYNGTGAGTTPVYLKVFATPNGGTETQYGTTQRQTPVSGAYAFTVPIAAGRVTYRVEFGTTTGGIDTPANTVTDLVCGDAYLIEGQSNAEATNNDVPADPNTSPWIRSYGKTLGWGYATNKDAPSELQLGVWGWIWAKHLLASYNMPICIINGALGGTRIDQHQPNPADHSQAGGLYSIYATLYNRIVGAKLTHGIRAVLWHQGEQDQGADGPFGGDYDYKFYQQYFVDMSAAWKQDFPNIRNYYIFQIWPPACGAQFRNDQLREVQRTLPYLYSNMRIMSTLGIVPGSSCHYVLEGYQKFSDLISPLVEQDFYGYSPGSVFSAPNLKKAYYSSTERNEITLEFDQNIAWNPGAPGLFFLDRLAGQVASGSASGKVIKLQLIAPSTTQTITYLRGIDWAASGSVQGNLLYGSNGIAALTFADVPLTLNSAYGAWASDPEQGLTTGVNDGPLDDPDHDGISNLLEFEIGGGPMAPSNTILPKLAHAGGSWFYEYDRSDLSQPSATIQEVEYGNNLTGWTSITIPLLGAGPVEITPGSPSDHVKVTLPNPGTKGFVRLKVTRNNP